jgi:hypothetical protein
VLQLSEFPGLEILPALLSAAGFALEDARAGEDTKIGFSLTTSSPFEPSGQVLVEFPAGFEFVSERGPTVSSSPKHDWIISLPPADGHECIVSWLECQTRVLLTWNAGSSRTWPPGTSVAMELTGVRVQPFAGLSGTFRVAMRGPSGLPAEVSTDQARPKPDRLLVSCARALRRSVYCALFSAPRLNR